MTPEQSWLLIGSLFLNVGLATMVLWFRAELRERTEERDAAYAHAVRNEARLERALRGRAE